MVPERCLTLALERLLARHAILVNPVERGEMGPDRRLGAANVSLFRPNGVTIRSQGTKAPVKTLEVRDRRSPLTTRRMSRIAKGSLLQGPLFSKQALAQIANSGGLRFHFRIASRARKRESCGRVRVDAGAFLPERGFSCATALT
jgi:hypothetical protein